MSGLLFLGNDDFHVSRGTKGNILCNYIPGFSLILFYSTQCEHCKELLPIFRKLPGTIGGCQFGIVNVGLNKRCVQMSKETILPITYVPTIILYINEKPFMLYNGPRDIGEIKRFIIEVSQNITNKQNFSRGESQPQRGGMAPRGGKGVGGLQQHHTSSGRDTHYQKANYGTGVPPAPLKHFVPDYAMGIPLYGDSKHEVTYLHFDNAYDSAK